MNVTRRALLRAGVGVAALGAPAVLKRADALASSGHVNVFAWGDYIQQNQIDAIEASTGIKVNLTVYGSNEEAERTLKASGGKGFDIVFPSVATGGHYYGDDLLAPIDEARLANLDAVIPSMLSDSIALGAAYRGRRMLLPFNWGTEGITIDSDAMPLGNDLSYGDLWSEAARGRAACRQKSAIMGVGLYLDAIGELETNRMRDVYKSEDDARRIWDACASFIIARKDRVAAFWNTAAEAMSAFKNAGAAIGQTWDTTGLLLGREDAKWRYRMPKEGGMAWMDCVAIPSGAQNPDQAYAFIDALLTPQMGGLMSLNTGYNSSVQGAAEFAGDLYKTQFSAVYNADNLSNLWWWQAETPWFVPLREDYADRISRV